MKIVVAIDSFKNCLSSKELSYIINQSIKAEIADCEVVMCPVSDGGENMVSVLTNYVDGEYKEVLSYAPNNEQIVTSYGYDLQEQTAYIDMASASGIEHLKKQDLNPIYSSTYGTGLMIDAALNQGAKTIIIGVGSSATIDLGLGALQALGAKLYDKSMLEMPATKFNLLDIEHVDFTQIDDRLFNVEIKLAVDVNNYLLGEKGAINTFGLQKGLSNKQIKIVEEKFVKLTKYFEQYHQLNLDSIIGGGAGGGFPVIFKTLFGAKMISGIELVLDEINFVEQIKEADLIITGEGFVDHQTKYGKVPVGVAKIAKKTNLPVICLAGGVEYHDLNLKEHGIDAIFSICNKPQSLEQAIKNTEINLTNIIKNILAVYQLKKSVH